MTVLRLVVLMNKNGDDAGLMMTVLRLVVLMNKNGDDAGLMMTVLRLVVLMNKNGDDEWDPARDKSSLWTRMRAMWPFAFAASSNNLSGSTGLRNSIRTSVLTRRRQ